MKKTFSSLCLCTLALMAAMLTSCNNKKFHINGTVTEAKDSVLYLENMSLDGPVVVDSVKLDDKGAFSFSGKAPDAPEFYRLRGLLDNPTSGQYWLDGQEVSLLKEKDRTGIRKGQIGFVFQSFNLIDELNVEENIELPLTYLKVGKAERKQKVQEVMKRMGITHRAKHFPHQLSGGQQQRVAIARAVVFGPKLILADEPTGNLDSKNGAEVMRLLTELNQDGTAIVMVTHNEHDAQIAHRTIHLFDGKIVG